MSASATHVDVRSEVHKDTTSITDAAHIRRGVVWVSSAPAGASWAPRAPARQRGSGWQLPVSAQQKPVPLSARRLLAPRLPAPRRAPAVLARRWTRRSMCSAAAPAPQTGDVIHEEDMAEPKEEEPDVIVAHITADVCGRLELTHELLDCLKACFY